MCKVLLLILIFSPLSAAISRFSCSQLTMQIIYQNHKYNSGRSEATLRFKMKDKPMTRCAMLNGFGEIAVFILAAYLIFGL